MDNRLYLVNLDQEFKGHAQSIVDRETSFVYYTDMKLDDYVKDRGVKNWHLLDWDSYYEMYDKPYHEKLGSKPFKQISEERYWDMLECLPPMKWHDIERGVNIFFISEAYTADLHDCFICLNNGREKKYYSALRSKYIKDEDVIAQLKEQGLYDHTKNN